MALIPPAQLKRDISTGQAFVRWKNRKWYFGKFGTRDSVDRFAKWLAEVTAHPEAPAPPSLITVAECVIVYMRYARGYYPRPELTNIKSAMQNLLNSAGNKRAIEFGPKSLKDIQRSMAKAVVVDKAGQPVLDPDGKTSLKYARTTINATVDRIRRCFRWCVSEELLPVEVSQALGTVQGLAMGRGLARESPPVRPVPLETVAQTLKFCSPSVQVMIQVQYLCGMRPSEVCGLTGRAIDKTGEIWLYRPEQHKNTYRGQNLTKAIPIVAQELLAPLLREDPDEPIFSPLETKLFFGNAGKKQARVPYTTASYGKSIVYAIARASKANPPVIIPHWAPNQLRHAIGTELRAVLGIEAAQTYLGHAKPDATFIYAERTEAALRKIAQSIVSSIGHPATGPAEQSPSGESP